MHWPITAGVTLASAAAGRMVVDDDIDQGVHWYFGGGLGACVMAMMIIDELHRDLAPAGTHRINRVRESCRATDFTFYSGKFWWDCRPQTGSTVRGKYCIDVWLLAINC